MESFYATGAVYFLWPVLLLTLLFEYVWCAFALAVSFGAARRGAVRQALRRHLLSVFVTSLGCDAALTGALYVLYLVSELRPAFGAALEAPFQGAAGTLAALLCIALVLGCGALKTLLYRRIVLKRTVLEEERLRLRACRLLGLLTTPWPYLVPTRIVYGVLGGVMTALGSLAPGELPADLPDAGAGLLP